MSGEGLVAADEAIRARDLAALNAALSGPADELWFALDKARTRLAALEEDGAMFGLMPHEQRELDTLRQIPGIRKTTSTGEGDGR